MNEIYVNVIMCHKVSKILNHMGFPS